ncbi:Tigger transposable element-derived protein 6 [Trichinella sp. T8]|nr:Tigger transposable element-derived protein 6 [Trichinella sp. T8]
MGISKFRARNGLLESLTRRRNIKFRMISDEAAAVEPSVINICQSKVMNIVAGYSLKDVFNADETGRFFNQLPQKLLTMLGEAYKGGSFSKERLTILLAANAAGERLVPLVIVEAASPRAFRHARVNVSKLSATWKYNRSAWMTAEVFVEWLEVVNAAMRQQHCEILLLLHNAPSHLHVELSNVKLEYFPATSTSCLQPMDLGVIRQFKCKYCSR